MNKNNLELVKKIADECGKGLESFCDALATQFIEDGIVEKIINMSKFNIHGITLSLEYSDKSIILFILHITPTNEIFASEKGEIQTFLRGYYNYLDRYTIDVGYNEHPCEYTIKHGNYGDYKLVRKLFFKKLENPRIKFRINNDWYDTFNHILISNILINNDIPINEIIIVDENLEQLHLGGNRLKHLNITKKLYVTYTDNVKMSGLSENKHLRFEIHC